MDTRISISTLFDEVIIMLNLLNNNYYIVKKENDQYLIFGHNNFHATYNINHYKNISSELTKLGCKIVSDLNSINVEDIVYTICTTHKKINNDNDYCLLDEKYNFDFRKHKDKEINGIFNILNNKNHKLNEFQLYFTLEDDKKLINVRKKLSNIYYFYYYTITILNKDKVEQLKRICDFVNFCNDKENDKISKKNFFIQYEKINKFYTKYFNISYIKPLLFLANVLLSHKFWHLSFFNVFFIINLSPNIFNISKSFILNKCINLRNKICILLIQRAYYKVKII